MTRRARFAASSRRTVRRGVVSLVLLLLLASCGGGNATNIFACTCPAVDDPVCGSDGVTYANGCNAECAGAKIAQPGYCGRDGGTCACPETSDPVCSGNGVTYENACSAMCAHQAIVHAGACTARPDGGPPRSDGGGAPSPGACTKQSCPVAWSGGPGQACVAEGCVDFSCTDAGDAGTCPPGSTYSAVRCNPGGPSRGSCVRPCTSPRHRCVDVPPSCNPARCSACFPVDVCNGAPCQTITDGIMLCGPQS